MTAVTGVEPTGDNETPVTRSLRNTAGPGRAAPGRGAARERKRGLTEEQRHALAELRGLVEPYRLRVQLDAEGWPVIPGRRGRIEWFCDGRDCHSCTLPGELGLAVWSDRPRLFAKLLAIPGVTRHQTGDDEMRAVFVPEALPTVARLIRARRRRARVATTSLANLRPRVTSASGKARSGAPVAEITGRA